MTNAIVAEGLVKRYGDVTALDGLDLAVEQGTVVGLLGPNGAGKTTTVRILATLLKPDAGRATVAGFDVVRQAQQLRHAIGLSGQYAAVDENLTGRENLWMVGRLYQIPSAEGRWYRRPNSHRFSRPVRFSSTAAYCPDSPMTRRISSDCVRTSKPATVARPASARRSVARMRTVVVLPAPFGPSRPRTVPSSTTRSTPSRARTSCFRVR